MRSGNGRHRRPRQAPALLVTAGMTGAGLAMPLLGASSAQAADAETWDEVAQCASGGVWSANTENGYYGGLQLTQDIWERYGGTTYAPRPDLASRSQQIAVAERILEQQGPQAWPQCAENGGLTGESTEEPDVDPGAPLPPLDALEGSEPATGAESDSPAWPLPDGAVPGGGELPESGAPDQGQDGGGDGGDGDPQASGAEQSGSDGGVGSTIAGDGDLSGDPGGDPAAPPAVSSPTGPNGEAHGVPDGPQTAPERSNERQVSRGGTASGRVEWTDGYRVEPGDTLCAIAERHGVSGGWAALYEANEQVVGGDPDLILPGQELDLRVGDQ